MGMTTKQILQGVHDWTEGLIVYDISAAHNNTKYADLVAALGTNGANVPEGVRRGGMSVKFVRGSDNKYVSYRLMSTSFSTDSDDWAFMEGDIYADNPEFMDVKTDGEGKIVESRMVDGTKVEYCDLEVKGNIRNEGFSNKVDKETGKGLIDADAAAIIKSTESSEYLDIEEDNDDKVLGGRKADGKKFENVGFETPNISVGKTDIEGIDDPEGRMNVDLDGEGRVISYRDRNGVLHENVGVSTPNASIESIELGESGKKYVTSVLNTASDILEFHPDKNIIPILANFKHYFNGTHGNPDWQDPKNFTFLWLSDLHSVWRRLSRIADFYNHYKQYIDDVVSTGDQNDEWDIPYKWGESGGSPFLSVLGNHDVHGPARVMPNYTIQAWTVPAYGQKECYEKYYKNFLNDTNIVIEENKCYFYKDYPEYKIRIIGTDDFHCNETIQCSVGSTTTYPDGTSVDTGQQLEWFENVLNETLDENNAAYGYSVMCLSHHPTYFTQVPCPFTSLYARWIYLLKVEFPQKVHQFIEDGGKFITWLVGDSHCEGFGTLRDFPEQLQIIFDASGSQRDNSGGYARIEGTVSDDLFDIVSVNTYKGYLSLKRIGCNYDRYGRLVDSMVYDYINKQIIQIN